MPALSQLGRWRLFLGQSACFAIQLGKERSRQRGFVCWPVLLVFVFLGLSVFSDGLCAGFHRLAACFQRLAKGHSKQWHPPEAELDTVVPFHSSVIRQEQHAGRSRAIGVDSRTSSTSPTSASPRVCTRLLSIGTGCQYERAPEAGVPSAWRGPLHGVALCMAVPSAWASSS